MNKVRVILIFLLIFVSLGQLFSATIYVNDDPSGSNDGTSWADAYTSLQTALSAATSGDQIWVAAGTYLPTTTTDRGISFAMKNGVEIYGGFAGTEANDYDLSLRDFPANESIISGDIGTAGNNSDNSYHIFYHPNGTNLNSTAILDGFTIKGANADGSNPHNFGGGMYNDSSSPTLTNCTITYNSANFGGGIFNDSSSPTLTNCTITNNSAPSGGGGMFNYSSSSPTLTNCTISNNSASSYGGGIFNYSSSPSLTNCTITDNSASDGGGMYNYSSSPTLTNCTITDNSASSSYGGGIFNDSSSPTLTNCTITNNSANNRGGGMYNYSSSPTLTNCTITDNSASSDGGGIFNDSSSPTLNNSIIFGNTATRSGKQIYISSGTATLNYSCYSNGTGDVIGTPTTSNCITSDPKFVGATNYDYRIAGNSPCADAGDDSYNSETNDIRGTGFARKLLKTDHNQTGTIDMGAYEYKEGTDPVGCQNTVSVDASYNSGTTGWGVTHFSDLSLALAVVCASGTVNIAPVSNTNYAGDVDMTGMTFIIGDADFNLTGNLTGGLIQVSGTGKLVMKDLAANTTKTFPITDGTYNYTMTVTTDDVNNPDISVRISNNNPSGSITSDFWDISGPTSLNATVTLRVDKAAIAPKTLNSNSQLRYYNGTRYVPVANSTIEEFDSYYIITISGVNQF